MKITDVLDEIRPTLQHKCNVALLDFLAGFNARRQVTIGGQTYLRFLGSRDRDTMFLPLGERGASAPIFSCSHEMREFYSAFDGLREAEPPTCGHFVSCREVGTVGEEFDTQIFVSFRRYADCPIVFVATNGDQMIQTQEGGFVWCVHSEGAVREAANSFARLLSNYIAYRSIGDGWPFDSYGRSS